MRLRAALTSRHSEQYRNKHFIMLFFIVALLILEKAVYIEQEFVTAGFKFPYNLHSIRMF